MTGPFASLEQLNFLAQENEKLKGQLLALQTAFRSFLLMHPDGSELKSALGAILVEEQNKGLHHAVSDAFVHGYGQGISRALPSDADLQRFP